MPTAINPAIDNEEISARGKKPEVRDSVTAATLINLFNVIKEFHDQ